jgi:ABC-type sugar transport system permease subunit/ABC-type glycerol-3-phosphate transport system substrate-binding protein
MTKRLQNRAILAFTSVLVFAAVSPARAGWIEERDGKTVIHVKVFALPDPTRADTATRANAAVVKEFTRRFPEIFRERYRRRYEQHPEVYGQWNWDQVEIELHSFTGITIPNLALDARPLMAIAGGVAPDILYVNFRQSDTYIQQRFLYPLDRPEDGYLASLSEAELNMRVHPKIWPVIRRKGPDGVERVWAMPYGGALGKVVLYRKDLFDAAGVPYPHNDWTWDDLLQICRALSDPARGIYGLGLGRGLHESWYWITFLWSAGGDVLEYDADSDQWRAVFDSPEAVEALDFYTRLNSEAWTDRNGRRRYGYTYKEPDKNVKWERGELGMVFEYVDEQLFATINPDMTGMVPVPRGPNGQRGAELNSRMMGLFAGIEHPAVRDAAWEYIRFFDSDEAMQIRIPILVEGGLGRFINPAYLERYGYRELVRFAPPGWKECFDVAMATGRPEPYGRNCQLVYNIMTQPLQAAEQMALRGELPSDPAARRDALRALLSQAVARANEKMIGRLSPRQLWRRRFTALAFLAVLTFALVRLGRRYVRAWTAAHRAEERARASRWPIGQRAAWSALLLPAVATILFWRYWPLIQGTLIAFQDYRIMGPSSWVWLDNFGAVLWDEEWWLCVWNSFRYSVLTVALTFLPPLLLAILLQEVPRGKLLFRLIFYLPAVMSSVVVILLWRTFYDPTESGALNAVLLRIPIAVFLALGMLFLLLALRLARTLWRHGACFSASATLLVGGALAYTCWALARPVMSLPDVAWWRKLGMGISEPIRWLQDPNTAMFACVLPMFWAGVGPGCLIYLAALKTIPDELYEVADLDGATFGDKILFIVFPMLKTLLAINFLGVFIHSWLYAAGNILAMTGGAAQTEVADLHIFYQAFMFLRFGPAAAMSWILGLLLIGFTAQQLQMLSRVEFTRAEEREGGR